MKEKKTNSLYIHIPFCEHICEYCDFTKLCYRSSWADDYLKHLFLELDSYKIGKQRTIYIGGGTPSSLNSAQLEALLKKVSPLLLDGGEFSIEANPENLTEEKLLILKKYGINRLSIGLETSDNQRLSKIGRHHTKEDVIECLKNAKKHGFKNINVDLMYGFPGETLKDLQEDLDFILSLDVPHVSIYSLIVEKGSIFYNKNIREQNEDDSRLFYDHILQFMRLHGYDRYEISNFAKNGYESRHNLTYWNNDEYYGIGLGASGYVDGIRYTNTKNLKQYLKDQYIKDKEEVNVQYQKEYFLLTHLRLAKGFSLEKYLHEFNEDFVSSHQVKIDELIKKNYAKIENGNFMFTDDGLMLMDCLILDLF